MAIAANGTKECKAYSSTINEIATFNLQDIYKRKGWINYILGVVNQMQENDLPISGFDIVLDSDLPVGAGLSSSAAIEGAVSFGLNELFDLQLNRSKLAKIGQLAEHTFAGVQCGIMDQFANLYGKKDHLIRLDCRDLTYNYFPFHFPGYKVVLCNSMVSHSLASSEYNTRRKQCEAGIDKLKPFYPEIKNLRDVTLEMLEAHKNDMANPVIYKRCHYVVQENERVLKACELLEKNDLEGFGKLMFATHEGLSKDYEVSCEELDELVVLAKQRPEVAGARMMGGGFGGCTINIVAGDKIHDFTTFIQQNYQKKFDKIPEIYVTDIEDGTSASTDQ
jgi:galactokinase